jgi:nucleoside-diphosphate-sugar epimerase
MGTNILITGATGFIGRHLTAALSKTHNVRCLVRKTSDISDLRNLNVEMAHGDLLVKDSLEPALDGIDLIYHLAGEVYSRHKSDYYKGNVLATQNLLESAELKGTKKIIFLSSIGVYKPKFDKTLLNEESECEPITFYGKTKLDAEELIKECSIPWVIVRAPVIYGPHQPAVLNKFFIDALTKKKIYVVGDGDNLRSLCFIQNLIEGLILLADKQNIAQGTYILSDNSPYTFKEIITTASSVIEQKIKIIRLPDILGDTSWKIYNIMGSLFKLYFLELYTIKTMLINLGCDITKAKTEIGYNPSVTLEAGIRCTVKWIKSNLSNKN